jgi:putative membrane protein insertion efficiency factor
MWRRLVTVSRETVLVPVHAWRLLSRWMPPRCKYYPSCSQYCLDAVRHRGVLVGLPMSVWRLLRCNPWSLGGIDYAVAPPTPHSCDDCTTPGQSS